MKRIADTFVRVAPDCPATVAVVPVGRGGRPTIATIQYELLTDDPYRHTLADLLVAIHVRRLGIPEAEATVRDAEIRADLFARPQACMQASPLPKTYGWGVHYDSAGRLGLHAVESVEYRRLATGAGGSVRVVAAMRSRRPG